jgi:hypothetical protein
MYKLKHHVTKLFRLLLVTAFLVFSQLGFAQHVSTLGLELGITFSQFPKLKDWGNANTISTDNPMPGPLIGISNKWVLSKHFYLTFGFQYQMAGRRYHIYDKVDNYSFSDNLTIHKICIPLDLGFGFKFGKFKPSFYLGLRPNIWLSAKKNNDGYKQNLFQKGSDDYKPPKRLLCQLSTGFSCPVGHHLQINVNFNYGNNYYVTTSWYHHIKLKTSISSSDYIISLIYYFNRSESKNE